MFALVKQLFSFSNAKSFTVKNVFNHQPIAHYTSPTFSELEEFLRESLSHQQKWKLFNQSQKEQKIIGFIQKLNQPQNVKNCINSLSSCTGKQLLECQAEYKVALKIFNFQLGYLYLNHQRRESSSYTFESFDTIISVFDHRHPILSAFAYLALALRSNSLLFLRPSPLALPTIKAIEKLWQLSSQVKIIRCLIDSESDPKHIDSSLGSILQSTFGFVNFSGRVKDGLSFHHYLHQKSQAFRENQFLLTSLDAAYVMKDLTSPLLAKAAAIIARACFSNCGHNFNSIKRVFVDQQIIQQFQQLLYQEAHKFSLIQAIKEDPSKVYVNEGSLAPFIFKEEFEENMKIIHDLKQNHLNEFSWIAGGTPISIPTQKDQINFISPTIFRLNVDYPNYNYQNIQCMMPICFLTAVSSPSKCIEQINSSIYGATVSLFTSNTDIGLIEKTAGSLDVGTVNVNTWQVTDGITYSGRKRSGKGFSLSPLSFNNVVRTKSLSYSHE